MKPKLIQGKLFTNQKQLKSKTPKKLEPIKTNEGITFSDFLGITSTPKKGANHAKRQK